MSAAFGLIMLAEAATACVSAPRFAGGATIVRPVGKAEPLPFRRLGPATGIEKDNRVEQTGAEAPPVPAREPRPSSQPCEPVLDQA
jgi:hypothetical protein